MLGLQPTGMATMEIETDDDILRKVASGGSMDYSTWPQLLTDIISRIEKIAHNDFPIPSIPPPSTAPPPPEPRFLAPLPSSDPIEPPQEQQQSGTTAESQDSSSQDTNKENAVPSASAASESTAPGQQSASEAAAAAPLEPGALPPQITAMLAEIKTTLVDGFPVYPPHTIQRLAELILAPRQHYRSLPSYLHAVDRVVHVTSGNNIYPLPPAIPDMSAMSLLANGVGSRDGSTAGNGSSLAWANASAAGAAAVGSDEALGGALLTPIPWLQRRTNGGSGSDASASPSPPISEGSTSQNQGPAAGAQASQQQQQRGGVQGGAGAAASRQFEGQVRTESTETIDGPNGMGSIETVSVSVNGIPSMGAARALTQGEILRQEQRAGVVPVSQLARTGGAMTATASPLVSSPSPSLSPVSSASSPGQATPTSSANAGGSASPEGPELTPSSGDEEMAGAATTPSAEEVPHARGPEEIGAADTGPQSTSSSSYLVGSSGSVEMRGIDVEAAVGRKAEHSHSPEPASTDASAALSPSSSKREADEDMDTSDAPAPKKAKEQEGDDVAGSSGAGQDEADSAAEEPKKDAEGDIVLLDEVPDESTGTAVEGAGSSGNTDGGSQEGKGGKEE